MVKSHCAEFEQADTAFPTQPAYHEGYYHLGPSLSLCTLLADSHWKSRIICMTLSITSPPTLAILWLCKIIYLGFIMLRGIISSHFVTQSIDATSQFSESASHTAPAPFMFINQLIVHLVTYVYL
jgi:hypothetical protein